MGSMCKVSSLFPYYQIFPIVTHQQLIDMCILQQVYDQRSPLAEQKETTLTLRWLPGKKLRSG